MSTFVLDVSSIEDLTRATGRGRQFHPTQMSSKGMTGQIASAKFGGLCLTTATFDSDIHVHSTFSDEHHSLAVMTQCDDITALGQRLRPGDVLTTIPGGVNEGRYKSPMKYAVANFTERELVNAAQGIGVELNEDLLRQNNVLRKKFPFANVFAKRAERIIFEMRSGALDGVSEAVEGIIAESVLVAIASAIATVDDGCLVESPTVCPAPKLLSNAEEFLLSRTDKKVTVFDMARELGVSQRSLFRIFKAETGLSPYQFLNRFRMSQARLDLARFAPDETKVTTIANDWGFWELGRFSVEYKKMFGESPRQTLHRVSTDTANCTTLAP